MFARRWCIIFAAVAWGCGFVSQASAATPINDLGTGYYLGQYQGGLYPGGTNEMPADHAAEGRRRTTLIQPRNPQGQLDPNGHYVMLSIGMSNARIEFTRIQEHLIDGYIWVSNTSCASAGPLVLYNGARASQTAESWVDTTVPPNPANPMGGENNYVRVARELSTPSYTNGLQLSTQQVQVGWLKNVNMNPINSLESTAPRLQKDVNVLLQRYGQILRTMKSEYPHLQIVFMTSRIYAYSTQPLNPEPFAYENGFAVKWLMEAQIRQMRGETTPWDDLVGDLRYSVNGQDGPVPWIAWGAYLWADGPNPRSDGLTWLPNEYDDGVHPNVAGCNKVADYWEAYFNASPFTRPWLLPPVPTVTGSHVFYNASVYDGNDHAANAADDAAIDADKQPLLPGQTSGPANVTGYARGLNGVMVDLAGAPDAESISAADFAFRVSTTGQPGSWTTATAPLGVAVRSGAGLDGSDRVTLIWADHAIQDRWLRVDVLPTARTGLGEAATFYWGHLLGDTGGDGQVNVIDLLKVQQNYLKPAGDPTRDDAADVTGDGNINVLDLLLVRQNYLRQLPQMQAP